MISTKKAKKYGVQFVLDHFSVHGRRQGHGQVDFPECSELAYMSVLPANNCENQMDG